MATKATQWHLTVIILQQIDRIVLLSLQQFPLVQVPDRGMKKQSRESSGGTRKKEVRFLRKWLLEQELKPDSPKSNKRKSKTSWLWINTYHPIALSMVPGQLPDSEALGWFWDGEKNGHLGLSFEGLVEHIKNKGQCGRHTSGHIMCVSVPWRLEMSLIRMSDLIYSSASWVWTTFHLGTEAKRQKHELQKTFQRFRTCLWQCQRDYTEAFNQRSGPSGEASRSTYSTGLVTPEGNDMNVTNREHHYPNWSQPFSSQWCCNIQYLQLKSVAPAGSDKWRLRTERTY